MLSKLKFLVYLGASFNLALAIYHCMFWQIFGLATELPKLMPDTQMLLEASLICFITIFSLLAFIGYRYAEKLVTTEMGRVIQYFWAGFLLVRFAMTFFLPNPDYATAFVILLFAGVFAAPAYLGSKYSISAKYQ